MNLFKASTKNLQKNLTIRSNRLPSNFSSALKNLVEAHLPALAGLHGTIEFFEDDIAQADAVIAARAARKITDLIVSSKRQSTQ
jgi:tRNA U34 5-carboxymethylaminomethyl modifying GTPase MnmE/TrmE